MVTTTTTTRGWHSSKLYPGVAPMVGARSWTRALTTPRGAGWRLSQELVRACVVTAPHARCEMCLWSFTHRASQGNNANAQASTRAPSMAHCVRQSQDDS